jgi:hypothetical protein
MTPATGQAAASVRSYLDAAAMQNPAVTRPFLVAGNSGDLADEFASNRLHGWMYNREMLRLYNEKIDMKSGKATVTARVVVQGGYPLAYMAAQRTFNLVAQDGVWKIASIDPPPQTR